MLDKLPCVKPALSYLEYMHVLLVGVPMGWDGMGCLYNVPIAEQSN